MPPQGVDPLVGAALRSIGDLLRSPEYVEAERLQSYFDGTQYDGLPFNWDGSLAFESGAAGAHARPVRLDDYVPPLSQRRPPANYPIGRTITRRLTNMLLGEGRFPAVKVDDDPDSEDFLAGVIDATEFKEKMKQARDIAGSARSAWMSWGYMAGAPRVEVHNPRSICVLEWADAAEGVPLHVLKFWSTDQKSVGRGGKLEIKPVWYAREWKGPKVDPSGVRADGYEAIYRYVPGNPNAPGGGLSAAYWERVGTAVAIDECPLAWFANVLSLDSPTVSRGDYEGEEGLIDSLNITLNATINGVAINADPTLCIDLPEGHPATGSEVKKGGYNTIFGRASYLEISGSSVGAGMGAADRVRALVFEGADVAMLDPEKLVGVQSGAAMRQLFIATTQQCDSLRVTTGKGGTRVLSGLLRLAQRLEASPPKEIALTDPITGSPMLGPAGEPVLVQVRGTEFKIPPRVTTSGASTPNGKSEKIEAITPRKPGRGSLVRLEWPQYFEDTPQDESARLDVIQKANGALPIVSPRTGIEMGKKITHVENVDKELADIIEGERQLADARAGALGFAKEGLAPPSGAPGEKPPPPPPENKPEKPDADLPGSPT
jgi:hypothetical protein